MSVADDLRAQFDRSFAAAPAPITPYDDFLALRIGSHAYALRLGEIASLHRDRKIVPLVHAAPHRLGIAGIRGALAPVFDLRSLVGHAGGPAPRWLVLTSGGAPVALAFDTFEGHLRVPRDCVSATAAASLREHIGGTVQLAGAVRLIIQVASLLEVIHAKESSQ